MWFVFVLVVIFFSVFVAPPFPVCPCPSVNVLLSVSGVAYDPSAECRTTLVFDGCYLVSLPLSRLVFRMDFFWRLPRAAPSAGQS